MKYEKSDETIYTTKDYDGFIFTDWNRNVSNARVVKMVESIKSVGWLPEPVMVNEKFEVIDGQSRIKALEKLGMPIQFCVRYGVGRKECQALNLFQKNWTTNDYINSYIADGNPNYIWLKEMINRYTDLTPSVIESLAVLKGRGSTAAVSGDRMGVITSGKLSLTDAEKVKVDNVLFYLSRFSETANFVGGRKDMFYGALNFLYSLEGIDSERVCTVVNNARYDGLVSSGTTEGWLSQIEVLYNKKLAKKNKVDLMHEYKKVA